MLWDKGILREQNGVVGFKEQFNDASIPTTLKDLLSSRLARLGSARETAQIAAAIGRTFDYEILTRSSLHPESTIQDDLDRLIDTGIVYRQRRVGNEKYIFHHALIRDAAYDSMLSTTRQKAHTRIAEVLEQQGVESRIRELAAHWAGAEAYEKATEYGLKAGTESLSRSAYAETINQVGECIQWTQKIENRDLSIERELKLSQLLVPALTAAKGFAHPSIREANERAEELSSRLPENSELRFPILWGMVIYYHTLPDLDKLTFLLEKTQQVAEESGDSDHKSAVLSIKGQYDFFQGRFDQAEIRLDESITLYNDRRKCDHALTYGHDTKVLCLGTKALFNTIIGELKKAEDLMDEAIRWAEDSKNVQSIAMSRFYQLGIWHYRGDKDMVKKLSEPYLKYLHQNDLMFWLQLADMINGWAHSDLKAAKKGIDFFEQSGFAQIIHYFQFIFAQTQFDNGLFREALECINRGISRVEKTGETFYFPELLRLKGQCLMELIPHEIDKIEAIYQQALDEAERINARLFKQRILTAFHPVNFSS